MVDDFLKSIKARKFLSESNQEVAESSEQQIADIQKNLDDIQNWCSNAVSFGGLDVRVKVRVNLPIHQIER